MDQSNGTFPLPEAMVAAGKRCKNPEQANIFTVQRQETEEELSIAMLLTPICPANFSFCRPCDAAAYQCIHCGISYCTYGCMLYDRENHLKDRMCNILRQLKKQNRRRQRKQNNQSFKLQHEMDLMWHEEVRKFQSAVMEL